MKSGKEATLTHSGNPLSNRHLIYTINGIAYDRITDSNGDAFLNIKLPVGEYPCNVSLNDAYYVSVDKDITVTVKSETYLTGEDVVKRSSDVSQYSCKLTNTYNEPMTFEPVLITINGITYIRDTDEEGIARLNIKLSTGEYPITATYNGNGLNAATTTNNKVVVTDLPGVRPWIESNVEHAPVVYVPMPEMRNTDEPIEESLPLFEKQVAGAIVECVKMSMDKLPDLSNVSWGTICCMVTREAE